MTSARIWPGLRVISTYRGPEPVGSNPTAAHWGIEKNNGANPNRQNPPAQNNPETTKDTRPGTGGRGGNVRRKRE